MKKGSIMAIPERTKTREKEKWTGPVKGHGHFWEKLKGEQAEKALDAMTELGDGSAAIAVWSCRCGSEKFEICNSYDVETECTVKNHVHEFPIILSDAFKK